MYFEFVQQMKKMLGQLDTWLAAGATFARERGQSPDDLLALRLAPDQFALVRQVQSACDSAKFVVARLTGKPAPSHPDSEQTLDELRARVRTVLAWLDTAGEADFAEAATRVVTHPRWEGKWMTGADYFREHGQPNFYFHVTHTYALLRHHGVGLGKRDYLGSISLRDAAAAS
jgi:uncharacterized protein